MIEFIPAAELKRKFGVFGHFYTVQVTPTMIAECRSVLEIVKTGLSLKKLIEISHRPPDAVFIMMNPGSSRPLSGVVHHLQARTIHELDVSLVPTKPDTTQYQMMRLMHYCEWRHVRVLNLSDLRCPKSNDFFKQFKALEADFSFDAHSVFSDRRTDELARKLTTGTPVIQAWGVSPHLDPLIVRCASKLAKVGVIRGILKEGTENKFLHPLPSLQTHQMEWVNRMVEQCRGS